MSKIPVNKPSKYSKGQVIVLMRLHAEKRYRVNRIIKVGGVVKLELESKLWGFVPEIMIVEEDYIDKYIVEEQK
jgi:hypothetical protein